MRLSQRIIPWLFVAALCFFGMAFFSIFVNSRADDIIQVATIGNATPVVASVMTTLEANGADQDNIPLVEGDARRIYISGTASDNNGCSEIDQSSQYTITLHRSDFSSSCIVDNNNCYRVETTHLTLGSCNSDAIITYQGYVDMMYYADPTDSGSPAASLNWETTVAVTDDQGVSSSTADIFEIDSLVALAVSGTLTYGSVNHGVVSDAKDLVFTNIGNRALNTRQSASGDMICDNAAGSIIPVSNVHMSLAENSTYAQSQALSIAPETVMLNLEQRTNENRAATQTVYFRIQIPDDVTIAGDCTNVLTFVAQAAL